MACGKELVINIACRKEGDECRQKEDLCDNSGSATMARRGTNLFKRNDGVRAIKIASEGGIKPAMVEIIAKDGTTFRVYDSAALTETTQDAKEWSKAIEELKATPKARRGKGND